MKSQKKFYFPVHKVLEVMDPNQSREIQFSHINTMNAYVIINYTCFNVFILL